MITSNFFVATVLALAASGLAAPVAPLALVDRDLLGVLTGNLDGNKGNGNQNGITGNDGNLLKIPILSGDGNGNIIPILSGNKVLDGNNVALFNGNGNKGGDSANGNTGLGFIKA